MSVGEWISTPINWVFLVVGLLTLLSAVKVVTAKNVVHAALFLVAALGGSAILFLMLSAEFVAWVVVLVYIGAVLVLFLIMAAMFRSVKDSLLVVLTIPLATVGGVLALRALNLISFQPLDLLTMIGFVIMMGLVINNAILLVDQTRASERGGVERREAVVQAIQLRIRPILCNTATSLVGMLPLAVVPGPGSTLYRGLGAVIVGGMTVSTVFTLLLPVPEEQEVVESKK